MKLLRSFRHKMILLAGIALVLVNHLLLRFRLRRRVDGWRRGAGLVLRGEAATFVLSAFSLDVWSDVEAPPPFNLEAAAEHFAQRLERFLAKEADTHICIIHGKIEDRAVRCGQATYTFGTEALIDGPRRFVRPEQWTGMNRVHRPAGAVSLRPGETTDVLLNFICRIHADGNADLWMRVSHVGADGVPMQEVLSRLESDWGQRHPVVFPTPEQFAGHHGPRHCAGRDGLVEVQDFVDFGPLLAWRKRENARLPEPMTISAAILWRLARHEALAGIHMGTTVEVLPTDGLGRGVGVVVVRPTDYFQRENGLAEYVREFNRQLNLARRRRSDGGKTLDAAAFLPAALESVLLQHALNEGGRAFGSLGLTMIRDAKVFGAPMGDAGHVNGFIAIGNVALDAGDGRTVGCVAIKVPPKLARYPAILRQALSPETMNDEC